MKIWKSSFFVTALLLAVTNIFWLYSSIDAGVSYSYQQVSLDEKIESVKMLSELIISGAQKYSKKDILHILRNKNKDAFIVEVEDYISVNGVKFIFTNGKLSNVEG